MRICQYSFTEMFNNAIEHSEGKHALVKIERTARSVSVSVYDDGIGIFEKIKSNFALADYRHAILELAKGKLTTDPKHHSGEGIFFTSRVFDEFAITANKYQLLHHNRLVGDWLIEDEDLAGNGTMVNMKIAVDSPRTLKEVFDRYANPDTDDYGFSRTHVTLRLAQYGHDQLMSRSQDKRVLSRFERFKEVFLDFSGIEAIGQAFADEIFRVYAADHPEIKLVAANANEQVSHMIGRAVAADKVIPAITCQWLRMFFRRLVTLTHFSPVDAPLASRGSRSEPPGNGQARPADDEGLLEPHDCPLRQAWLPRR